GPGEVPLGSLRPESRLSGACHRIEHVFDPRSFVHLNVRSNFSLKDGAFFPEELALRAAELEMPAVALTDRDGLYGAARFVDQCAKAGVRPILGATLTIAPGARGEGHPRGGSSSGGERREGARRAAANAWREGPERRAFRPLRATEQRSGAPSPGPGLSRAWCCR